MPCPHCQRQLEAIPQAVASVCSHCHTLIAHRENKTLGTIPEPEPIARDFFLRSLEIEGKAYRFVGHASFARSEGDTWHEWYAYDNNDVLSVLTLAQAEYLLFTHCVDVKNIDLSTLRIGSLYTSQDDKTPYVVDEFNAASCTGAVGALPFSQKTTHYIDMSGIVRVASLQQDTESALLFFGKTIFLPITEIFASCTLSCTQCHKKLFPDHLRLPQWTQHIGCPHCGALLRLFGDGSLSFVEQQPTPEKTSLALGNTFNANGHLYWVAGILQRKNHEETWREYLLYAITGPKQWLIETEQAWYWASPISSAAVHLQENQLLYQGASFTRFSQDTATVVSLQGSCYWHVRPNEAVTSEEFACAQRFDSLHRESTMTEQHWTRSEIISQKELSTRRGRQIRRKPL